MKRVAGIENFRIVAAILVIANHTAVLSSFSEEADFLFSYCLGRVAVPFFFMVSGYFVIGPWLRKEEGSAGRVLRFLWKTCCLYVISTVLYIPVMLYSHQLPGNVLECICMVLFDGTYYHLWYFVAVIVGTGVLFVLHKLPFVLVGLVTVVLYAIGVGGDLWYGFVTKLPVLKSFYDVLFSLFTYTRNGLFFAPFFLWLGAAEKDGEHTEEKLALSFAFLIAEGVFTYKMGFQKFNSMYLSLVPLMWFLFAWLKQWKVKGLRHAGDISLLVYIIHPLVILFTRLMAKVIPAGSILVENSVLLFCLTVCLSFAVAIVFVSMRSVYERKKKSLVRDF